VPLTRIPLEVITGVDRNSPTGSKPAPARVYNGSFFREGGIGPFAGRALNVAAGSTNEALLAYDESSMALFSTPAVFTNNLNLIFLSTSDNIFARRKLTLIPRSAVVTEFIRTGGAFTGRAFVRSPQGAFEILPPAPVINVAQAAGGSLPNGTAFNFVCVVEAPSDAGLVAYGFSEQNYTTTSSNVKITLTLADVIPESHVARIYWRTTADSRFSLFASLVSDGVAALTVEMASLPTPVPVEDSIINFAPSRAELHEGRVFGVASDRPFMTIVPDSALKRRDAYFQRAIQENKTTPAFSTTGAGSVMRQPGDWIAWSFRKAEFYREIEGAKVVVPLAYLLHGSTNLMEIFLDYVEAGGRPRFVVNVNGASGSAEIPGPGIPSLDAAGGSRASFDALDLEVDIASVVGTLVTFNLFVLASGTQTVIASTVLEMDVPGWAAWEATGTTSVELFSSTSARDGFAVEWTRVRANSLLPGSDAFAANVRNYASGLSWTNAASPNETWNLGSVDNVVVSTYIEETAGAIEFSQPRLTLVYSDVGSANRGSDLNYFVLNASNSSRITALASTAAGLLIFMDNETWLLSGNVDPYFSALAQEPQARIQRFSGTLGCDAGVIPGRLGGVVFPIYKGELYAITLGMGDVDFGGGIELIGLPIHLKEDPIVQVVGEAQTNHVVVRTRRGAVYRFDTRSKQWADDVFSEFPTGPIEPTLAGSVSQTTTLGVGAEFLRPNSAGFSVGSLVVPSTSVPDEQRLVGEDGVPLLSDCWILFEDEAFIRLEATPDNNRVLLIPACLCGTYATRLVIRDRFAAVDLSLKDKVAVRWDALDFGDKTMQKLWRRVEVKTSASYSGSPTLRYRGEGVPEATVSGVSLGNGSWVFSFGRGVVSAALDIELEFNGMLAGEVFEPPVTFEIASRNRPRGRVA